ncbi:CWF19-like protein 2 [Trichosurus vulpecula]|uniref:CWF19-like protein 2 n=1 Tax=Trichosurus vulpecula TaxID=9337 RepID=UPI00186B170E|nr:CWF19-like protein 2 [Trichosurus vulpecula]
MAASSGRFESARSIEERKEQKRQARAEVLRQAKADFEKEERRKELKRLRGEDTWMLADVNERVEQLSQEHSVKKKRKKDRHSKKAKKEKKKKSKKQKHEKNESSDSSSSSEDEWVEAVPLQATATEKAWKVKKEESDKKEDSQIVQRDEWMTFDFMSAKTVSSSSLKAERQTAKKIEQEKAQAIEQSRLSERELNPYWKDGGTGLPPEDANPSSVAKVSVVEDGGLSWLKKSYQRMKEQAEKQNRNFEDVVAERYGSVETFQLRLEEAKKAASKSDNYGRERWRKSRYSDKEQSGQESKKQNMEKHVIGDTNRDTCSEYSSGSYSKVNMTGDQVSSKDKFRGDERDYRSRFIESDRSESYQLRKDDDSRKKQNFSLLGNIKHKFLRPSEDDELSFHSRNSESPSSSALLGQNSLNHSFLKPDESIEQISFSWSHEKRGGEKQNSDQKSFNPTRNTTDIEEISKNMKEKPQEENPSPPPEKREFLQETKTSLSGYNSDDGPSHLLSEDEMNKLGAKIIKAELMGKMDLAAQLKTQLDKARKLKEIKMQESTRKYEMEGERLQEEQEVVLVRTDRSGRVWPVNAPGVPSEPKEGRRKKQMVTTHIDKERVRYFHDDDDLSLKDLVKNEKMGTAEDQNRAFMKMASKLTEKTDKEYYSLDDMFVSKAAKKECLGGDEEKQKKKAISEHQKLAAQMEKCPYCFDSSQLPKHLIVAIGVKVYLCLPNCQSLTEGHCLIVPLQHHTAATVLDEDIWEEIQSFRKALVRMFEDKELDCIFLETNMSMNKRYHMVYECIPLPKEVGDMAPIYFKKAIMESDEEWSMNKKLIDLSSRDIRKSVPRGLPYFSVDFGLQGGFAHVIEDQQKFPHYFGKEIIGGMLDAEPRLWRKGIRENFENQRKKVLQFAQWWKPYDFTKSK